MARITIVIVIAAIIASIGIAFSYYVEFQPNFLNVNAGEPVKVGPVKYIVEYIGNHAGDEKTQPKNTFFQVSIVAENEGKETTRITGGQFYILDKNDNKVQPVFGNFSENDLLTDMLEPNVSMSYTTQFDIPFDENEQYRVGVLPTKEQSSRDIGIICVVNC
ncbi:MAG TPA: DUF4352 domain-containing protein [Nitrosopumilaceae archaeon]|nr:DUF4352 domain-containing protein [Nitrosopumilaceae archaeon]